MGYLLLARVCFEEEVGHKLNDPISGIPDKEDMLLTIYGNPVDGLECMFEQGIYLSILYCLCFFHEKDIDMLKYQLRGEKYPNLELEDNFIFPGNREKHWKDVIV